MTDGGEPVPLAAENCKRPRRDEERACGVRAAGAEGRGGEAYTKPRGTAFGFKAERHGGRGWQQRPRTGK